MSRTTPVTPIPATPFPVTVSLDRARSVRAVRLAAAALCFSALLTDGCRVGPKYVSPLPASAATAPSAFKEGSPDAFHGVSEGTWRPANPQDATIKGKWWEIFQEPELNALEDRLDISNQNIALYFQNFMAARAIVREEHAQLYPTLTTGPSYGRTKSSSALRGYNTTGASTGSGNTPTTGTSTSTSSTGNTYTALELPFDVSWEPDLWGRIRNTIREYQYAAQVSAADLENERLTEQADLAVYYFELRGQDALQDVFNRTIQADRQALELTQVLVQTGIDSPESTAQAEVTLRNAEEAGAGVASNRAIYEHAIATLIGQPAPAFAMPVRPLTTPVPAIPVGVPSTILQRRPDIAAAERTLAEANALIGVEQAAYYPSLNLTGSGGVEASQITTLFTAPALFWSVGAAASQTIFDAGLRRATVAQYTAQYNADVASYRQTVLTAFQQVEDYIATLRVSSDQDIRETAAVNAAQRYLDIAQDRYKTGLDPYLNVITAQNTLLSNQETQVNLRVTEMTAAVQLIQALGGGWNIAQLPAAGDVTRDSAARQAANTP